MRIDSDIDSLTNFKRQTADYLERLRSTGEPLVLTINGKAKVVVQDASAYQKLIDQATKIERDETIAAIREGLADIESGRTKPACAALERLAKRFGLTTPER